MRLHPSLIEKFNLGGGIGDHVDLRVLGAQVLQGMAYMLRV